MKSASEGTSVTSCNWLQNGTVISTDWCGFRPVVLSSFVISMYARETSFVGKPGYGFWLAKFGNFPDWAKIACIHKSGFPMVAPFWTIGKNTRSPELL